MGANLKRHFLVCYKTEPGVIYTGVIEQVEPQSHAGEKAFYDSVWPRHTQGFYLKLWHFGKWVYFLSCFEFKKMIEPFCLWYNKII